MAEKVLSVARLVFRKKMGGIMTRSDILPFHVILFFYILVAVNYMVLLSPL
jgi:hypothetical protein